MNFWTPSRFLSSGGGRLGVSRAGGGIDNVISD